MMGNIKVIDCKMQPKSISCFTDSSRTVDYKRYLKIFPRQYTKHLMIVHQQEACFKICKCKKDTMFQECYKWACKITHCTTERNAKPT